MNINFITNDSLNFIKKKSIYIYGAGEYAHDISRALANNQIRTKAFIIDDNYAGKIEKRLIEEITIISLSEYRLRESKSDIVINGIANTENFLKVTSKQIFKCLYLWYEPVPLWKYEDEFFKQNKTRLKETESLFADDDSKVILYAFLEAKRAGGSVNDINVASQEHTYFNSLTEMEFCGAYVDCGAYNGDSVNQYFSFIGNQDTVVFAFEPDDINFNIMKARFEDKSNVHCFNMGIWHSKGQLNFNMQGDMASKLTDTKIEDQSVNVTDIDSIVSTTTVGFIKMDIEGSELFGLQGAQNTIRRDHPILAISAYHKQEDLITLPKYIKQFENEDFHYDLYLRHHGVCAYELVLYAIPIRK